MAKMCNIPQALHRTANMTTLSHPFKEPADVALPELDTTQQQLVNELIQWCAAQPKFPNFSHQHAHQFLHACLWDARAARKSMQKYCSIRANSSNLFAQRDPQLSSMQSVLDIIQMVAVPRPTAEGYHILIYRLVDFEPSRLNFADAVKAFCMFNDYRISRDGLTAGYVVVFDMKGIRLGHLSRVQLGAMRAFMSYIQDAHPVRLKKVYVVNTASFINQVMALVRPFIRTELFALLQFTSNGPLDVLSADRLPSDYDGELGTMASFYERERAMMETDYHDWLVDSGELRERQPAAAGGRAKDRVEQTLPMAFGRLEID